MSRKNILLLIILWVTLSSCRRQAADNVIRIHDTLTGTVTRIYDGDTYQLQTATLNTYRLRMEGIDAPEYKMPYSRVAAGYLNELCYNRRVKAVVVGIDQYERPLVFTYLPDGRELSREMLRAGLAWHHYMFNNSRELAALEKEARLARRGLWEQDDPMPPWVFKRREREKRQPAQ